MATTSFNPCRSYTTARFDSYFFFTIKNHLCASVYATTVCAIKSTQLKQGQTTRCVFFNARTVIRRYLTNELTCVARKTTSRTRKRFHNKQYTPKSKDQPLESDRTLFDIRFNNGIVATYRPTIFSSFSQNHNRSIKNNQPEQSIVKSIANNNKQPTQSLNQKHAQNKHDIQSNNTPRFVNIKIIAIRFAAEKYFPEPTHV